MYSCLARSDMFYRWENKEHIRFQKQMIQVGSEISINRVNHHLELINLNLKSVLEHKKCDLKILVELSNKWLLLNHKEHNLILFKSELMDKMKHKEFKLNSKFINYLQHIRDKSLNFEESASINHNPKSNKERIDSFLRVELHHVQQEE